MKVHLVPSSEPLKPGKPTEAACGKPIEEPEFVFTYEGDLRRIGDLSTLGNCTKCVRSKIDGRYLYGVIDRKL
jgi:hypothetical protein